MGVQGPRRPDFNKFQCPKVEGIIPSSLETRGQYPPVCKTWQVSTRSRRGSHHESGQKSGQGQKSWGRDEKKDGNGLPLGQLYHLGTEIGLRQVSKHPDSGQDFVSPENLVELPATFCRLANQDAERPGAAQFLCPNGIIVPGAAHFHLFLISAPRFLPLPRFLPRFVMAAPTRSRRNLPRFADWATAVCG